MADGRFPVLLLTLTLLLAGCSLLPAAEEFSAPDSPGPVMAATATQPPTPTQITGSPTAFAVSPTAASAAMPTLAPNIVAPEQELCSDQATGGQMSYREAQVIAARSVCSDEGELLPAHFCNANTGTWWIGLNAPREGCSPACVVNVNDGTVEINWRCTGLAAPPAAESTLTPTAAPVDPAASLQPFRDWQGTIRRLAPGGQVEYQFQRDDGQAFLISARDTAVRLAITDAAWSGAPVTIAGSETAVPGLLNLDNLTIEGDPAVGERDLTPFASPTASSALAADVGGAYVAWSAIDGMQAQPWCEGVDGPGAGEWLQLDFSAPIAIERIELANGFDGEGQLFYLNNRIQSATLTFDGGETLAVNLDDSPGLQSFPLAAEVSPGLVTASVRLVIEETYPGWTFDDTCLGEIIVYGYPAG